MLGDGRVQFSAGQGTGSALVASGLHHSRTRGQSEGATLGRERVEQVDKQESRAEDKGRDSVGAGRLESVEGGFEAQFPGAVTAYVSREDRARAAEVLNHHLQHVDERRMGCVRRLRCQGQAAGS